jgi:hypothetical protein
VAMMRALLHRLISPRKSGAKTGKIVYNPLGGDRQQ